MNKKYLFISEALSAPFDEGIKNVAFEIYKHLKVRKAVSVTNAENNTDHTDIIRIRLNKFFLNKSLIKTIHHYSPDIILYLPEASITFNSFIRAKVLKLMSRYSKVAVLGVQHRKYSILESRIIEKLLVPDILFLLGSHDMDFFEKRRFRVKQLPPAVDCEKFRPSILDEKQKIRSRYKIPTDKKVVLHVGHIKTGRNIECLMEIQNINNIQVVIVGSTTTDKEMSLKSRLVDNDVIVIDEFVSDIAEIYRLSDIYVFPVVDNANAIDMPLSVLEAIATNLPVITTRFGGLINYFQEDTGFRYFETVEELRELVTNIDTINDIQNYKKVKQFSWGRFVDEIIVACCKDNRL